MPFPPWAARSVPSPVVRIRGRQVCGPPLGALLQVLVAVELGQQSLLTPQLGVVGVALELYVELPCGGFGVAGHLRGPRTGDVGAVERKSVVEGTGVGVRGDLGGRGSGKKKMTKDNTVRAQSGKKL